MGAAHIPGFPTAKAMLFPVSRENSLGQQRLPLQPAFPFVCVGWSIRTWKKKGEISADLKENSQECKIKISFGHGLGAVVGGYRDKHRAHLHLN